jgi:hypothetical protein
MKQTYRNFRQKWADPWLSILGAAAVLAVAPAAWAAMPGARAQRDPRIGYVYPAGGRQGATFQVTIGGQYLDGVSNVYVSGAGVQAAVVEHTKPLTQREFTLLREKLKELHQKRLAATQTTKKPGEQDESQSAGRLTADSTNTEWTAEDEQMVAEIKKKLANPPNRQANPAMAETVTIEVTMAPDTEPGERELRLGTPSGLSNPLVFCVGQLAEFSEKEPKSSTTPGLGSRPAGSLVGAGPAPAQPEPGMSITLPAIVNGQILPGDVDPFRFEAHKGEQLVVAASARELIPYLADAVPGWFQATLALYDASGKELAYADDYRFHPDPVLFYVIPQDGQYLIEIRDAIYRGREDFVYRIAVGELPFVTSIFPLGGPAGTQTTVEANGWNLPAAELTLDPGPRPGISNLKCSVPFAVDTLPECLEQEPDNQQGQAQPVTLPIIVNGRIDQPGDVDMFSFEGHAGDQIVAEVYARRLDSPVDSTLKLTDATGRQLAFNDDHEDKGAGLTTHHADSLLSITLPADGTYYLALGDAQHKGGPAYGYRLRISPPQPDFELRVVPSSVNARAGATAALTVYALRKDGFSDEIALTLKDAPSGFTLSGGRVPAGQDQAKVTLKVPPTPTTEPVSLHLEGRAIIQGREIVRPAVPADDMMQAFFYRHLVPAKDLKVAVIPRAKPGPRRGTGFQPVDDMARMAMPQARTQSHRVLDRH